MGNDTPQQRLFEICGTPAQLRKVSVRRSPSAVLIISDPFLGHRQADDAPIFDAAAIAANVAAIGWRRSRYGTSCRLVVPVFAGGIAVRREHCRARGWRTYQPLGVVVARSVATGDRFASDLPDAELCRVVLPLDTDLPSDLPLLDGVACGTSGRRLDTCLPALLYVLLVLLAASAPALASANAAIAANTAASDWFVGNGHDFLRGWFGACARRTGRDGAGSGCPFVDTKR